MRRARSGRSGTRLSVVRMVVKYLRVADVGARFLWPSQSAIVYIAPLMAMRYMSTSVITIVDVAGAESEGCPCVCCAAYGVLYKL